MGKSSNLLKSRPTRNVPGKKEYQIIRDTHGAPEYYLVPFADFQALLEGRDEDTLLIAAADVARGDEVFPEDVARRLVAGETPLKVIREWRGMTQSQLGGKSHVPSQYISQIERSARHMGRSVAKRLASALGVSAEILMDI